jgi:hypothetical protein
VCSANRTDPGRTRDASANERLIRGPWKAARERKRPDFLPISPRVRVAQPVLSDCVAPLERSNGVLDDAARIAHINWDISVGLVQPAFCDGLVTVPRRTRER